MLKDMTYQQKFEILSAWMPSILEAIKKDVKEHLQTDKQFFKSHFSGKQIQKISPEELAPAYERAIAKEDGEKLGEFIAVRWILKHSDVYHYFEKHLKAIDPKFDELQVLQDDVAHKLMVDAVHNYGAVKTYLFSVMNSVVYPDHLYETLKDKALQEYQQQHQETAIASETATLEDLKKRHELELRRTVDKYEKKLSGLQSKYITDTETLKKQMSLLQRKLHEQKTESSTVSL
jgi:hypothetical protein